MKIDPPDGRRHRYGWEQSIIPVLTSVHRESLIGLVRLACFGESIVNTIPCSARISRVSMSTAVSGSHMPSGLSLIHISEPTRRTPISYAVFCLKKKTRQKANILHKK